MAVKVILHIQRNIFSIKKFSSKRYAHPGKVLALLLKMLIECKTPAAILFSSCYIIVTFT